MPVGYRCVVCGEKKGAATMLLCDQCQRGWHIACLTLPLSTLPKGESICPRCKEGIGSCTVFGQVPVISVGVCGCVCDNDNFV